MKEALLLRKKEELILESHLFKRYYYSTVSSIYTIKIECNDCYKSTTRNYSLIFLIILYSTRVLFSISKKSFSSSWYNYVIPAIESCIR